MCGLRRRKNELYLLNLQKPRADHMCKLFLVHLFNLTKKTECTLTRLLLKYQPLTILLNSTKAPKDVLFTKKKTTNVDKHPNFCATIRKQWHRRAGTYIKKGNQHVNHTQSLKQCDKTNPGASSQLHDPIYWLSLHGNIYFKFSFKTTQLLVNTVEWPWHRRTPLSGHSCWLTYNRSLPFSFNQRWCT